MATLDARRRWQHDVDTNQNGMSSLMLETLAMLADGPRTFGDLQQMNASAAQTMPALAKRGYALCTTRLTDRADSQWQITAAGLEVITCA